MKGEKQKLLSGLKSKGADLIMEQREIGKKIDVITKQIEELEAEISLKEATSGLCENILVFKRASFSKN